MGSPPAFTGEEGTNPWYVGLRGLDGLRLRHDPLLRSTYRQGAGCVLGIAPYVGDHLAGADLRRFEVMSDTGLVTLPREPVNRAGRQGQVRLLYVGRWSGPLFFF